MVRVLCRTNLDLSHEEWPTMLPAVPRVGDYIESATTHKDGFRLQLEVVTVTWVNSAGEWYPIVELHCKRGYKQSIREFYTWYAPLVGRDVSVFI